MVFQPPCCRWKVDNKHGSRGENQFHGRCVQVHSMWAVRCRVCGHGPRTGRRRGSGDMLFCGAPHLFVAHVKATGRWAADYAINCNLATAYFELLTNAHGLGTVIMSYPSDVICELAPEAREMLGIPSDHYMKLIVGFGYPEISYARGTQKNQRKVHRWTEQSKGQLSLL